MKICILVVDLGMKNLKDKLNFDFADIDFQSSIIDAADISNLKNYNIIIISDYRGEMSTIGYLRLIKKSDSRFKVIVLSKNHILDNATEEEYIRNGADSYFLMNDIEKLKDRINFLYLSVEQYDERCLWRDCTKKTVKFMKYNYSKLGDNFLEIISSKLNYSTSAISHYVKEDTGKSVTEWLLTLKTDNAIELLKSTDHQIKFISSLVGYKSVQGLIKSVKKRAGKTPKEIRSESKY
jgi:YesN/AraC family two-component response regulator